MINVHGTRRPIKSHTLPPSSFLHLLCKVKMASPEMPPPSPGKDEPVNLVCSPHYWPRRDAGEGRWEAVVVVVVLRSGVWGL